MWTKERMNRLAFWGIMMACLGVSVFDNPMVGRAVCFTGLALLIVVKVVLWRRQQRIP